MTTTTESLEFCTSGYLTQLLQRSPSEINTAAEKLAIRPALIINEKRHFSSSQVDQLVKFFREQST